MPRLIVKSQPAPATADQPQRKEQLAIHLADLDRLDQSTVKTLLAGRVSVDGVVKVDVERPKELAVRFVCDLLTAATICQVIRGYDRLAGDSPTRLYVRNDVDDEWRQVPGTMPLLRQLPDGTAVLEPSLFAPIPQGVVPLPTKMVTL